MSNHTYVDIGIHLLVVVSQVASKGHYNQQYLEKTLLISCIMTHDALIIAHLNSHVGVTSYFG